MKKKKQRKKKWGELVMKTDFSGCGDEHLVLGKEEDRKNVWHGVWSMDGSQICISYFKIK